MPPHGVEVRFTFAAGLYTQMHKFFLTELSGLLSNKFLGGLPRAAEVPGWSVVV